ncbi:MAG: YggS family pyridoxal phosphate-dependent enzyme [Ginsengibacter sp.]
MTINKSSFDEISTILKKHHATLVAVSKVRTEADIMELYNLGQRDFGENYVQELVSKQEKLPKDIRWHFIGNLQSNKVKYIAPFIHLIHGVDRPNLLKEINKQALRNDRKIDYLLQVHIAEEDTKFGFDQEELKNLLSQNDPKSTLSKYPNVQLRGLMGMATFTSDENKIRREFRELKKLFDIYIEENKQIENENNIEILSGKTKPFILSMGMSADYKIALEEGSNMVRIGSLLFGARL